MFPKLQKVTSVGATGSGNAIITRQDTIEEMVEVDDSRTLSVARTIPATSPKSNLRKVDTIINTRPIINLRKFESCDSGVTKASDTKLEKDNNSIENGHAQEASSSLTTLPTQLVFPNTEYKEIMSNIMNFKVDVKLEVQRINQKIGRLEELLCDLVLKLSEGNNRENAKETKSEVEELETGKTGGQQKNVNVTTRTGTTTGVNGKSISSGIVDRYIAYFICLASYVSTT